MGQKLGFTVHVIVVDLQFLTNYCCISSSEYMLDKFDQKCYYQ